MIVAASLYAFLLPARAVAWIWELVAYSYYFTVCL